MDLKRASRTLKSWDLYKGYLEPKPREVYGTANPKSIHDLLRVGVSKKAIAQHLKIDPKIVDRMCSSWKRRELPKILRQRAGIS